MVYGQYTMARQNPVTAHLVAQATRSLAGLRRRGYSYPRCYRLATGASPDGRVPSLGSLYPSEIEAIIDVGLATALHRRFGASRPDSHEAIVAVLKRMGTLPHYLRGQRTAAGYNADERHAAAVTGRPLATIPAGGRPRPNRRRPVP